MPILIVFLVILVFLYWQNNNIVTSQYIYSSSRIPISFDKFKILHISDFHNKQFGKNGEYLISKIIKTKPDMIVITGDLIDRRRYDLDIAVDLGKKLINIAPVYYVTGNHEAWSGKCDDIILSLEKIGINVLEDENLFIERGDEKLNILGIKENMESRGGLSEKSENILEEYKVKISETHDFTILLAHRPELFPLYQKYPLDLVFAGHAHGGQVQIPFFGAIFAPDQGLMPKYYSGKYYENGQTMFLSRGLGNSLFPIRLFNRPELILVELNSK